MSPLDRLRWLEAVHLCPESTMPDKAVAAVLCVLVNSQSGAAWPSVSAIARRAGVSVSTARRALRRLEAKGHIETEQSLGRGASVYRPTRSQRPGCQYEPGHWSPQPGHSDRVTRSQRPPNKGIEPKEITNAHSATPSPTVGGSAGAGRNPERQARLRDAISRADLKALAELAGASDHPAEDWTAAAGRTTDPMEWAGAIIEAHAAGRTTDTPDALKAALVRWRRLSSPRRRDRLARLKQMIGPADSPLPPESDG